MRLTRLYIPALSFVADMVVPLGDDHSHYLLRVLRMEAGHEIVLFNEQSGAWRGTLQVTGKKAFAFLKENIQQPSPPSDIYLLASPLKKEAWDFVVEKATELGVAQLQPVLMDFTQNARVNDERIKANLVEASQQCERTHIPAYKSAEKLDSVLKNWDASRILYVALERSDAKPAAQVFDASKPGAILIGPEGGFSPRERELLQKYDFVRPVTLGGLILRAETAALKALSVWPE